MAGVLKVEQRVKLPIVMVLLTSISDGSDASRPLKGEAVEWTGEQHSSNLLVSVMRAVVTRSSAAHSGCTYDPNTIGGHCP